MIRTFFILFFTLAVPAFVHAQIALIKETVMEVPTYGFSDPDPLPMLGSQPELYPYFKFSTYTQRPESKKWKVVVLENPYLKVEILPEVGGKIWGVTEKKSGYDIIYKNETLKFRNIATRGPWTSGGIEFNFGFFGHTPYAATPVNYKLEELPDGSVACLLGASDLPSRSDWRVKIILPADKAWLKIEYLWNNTNPYTYPYYYWTNAAVRATDDLHFFYPGTHQIGHGGDAHPFPTDEEGRDLSMYVNNAFGGNKSYHILGDDKPFKAVYWKNLGVGVGSLTTKQHILGKKLWIWSMAPAGAVWEDLLTDRNGQYIEMQSGRLYNQASPESGLFTPYTQFELRPYQCDAWFEYWFPVIGTGGVSEASKEGVLYVENQSGGSLKLHLMALEKLQTEITARSSDGRVWRQPVNLQPTGKVTFDLPFTAVDTFDITVGQTDLSYSNRDPYAATRRPMLRRHAFEKDPSAMKLAVAEENFKYRRLTVAEKHYREYLEISPYSTQALTRLAEICLRTHREEEAEILLVEVLGINTYDGYANFLFGLLSSRRRDVHTAEECFAIATRTREWKVPAFIEMIQSEIVQKQYGKAVELCGQALEYDVKNINIRQLLMLAARKNGEGAKYQKALEDLLHEDGLNNFALIEQAMNRAKGLDFTVPQVLRHSEFAGELLLEQAIWYYFLGCEQESVALLKELPESPVALYWLASLDKEHAREYLNKAGTLDIFYVFPYRDETYAVLKEAAKQSSSWKILYYQALCCWRWGDIEQAASLFKLCGNPATPYFYSIRGCFYKQNGEQEKALGEYKKHYSIDKSDWRVYHRLINCMKGKERLSEALKLAQEGMKKFKDQFILQYDYARLLLMAGRFSEALSVLRKMVVLPAEHTGSAYPLYYAANLLQALAEIDKECPEKALIYVEDSKKWPSNLGGGFGYTTDYRLQELVAAFCQGEEGQAGLNAYIDAYVSLPQADELLKSWIEAQKHSDTFGMDRAATLIEDRMYDTGTVSSGYVLLKIFQKILTYKPI